VRWADSRRAGGAGGAPPAAEIVPLRSADDGWTFADATSATKRWNGALRSQAELETCAPCHSRRRVISDGARAGEPLLDHYVPALLSEGLYAADGQRVEEVYEYGSFLQSKMHRAGVVCSDCHDPHSLKLRASGNQLCAHCHAVSVFDSPAHHHHPPGSSGAQCVSCHMPSRTYMVIDERRDHSFRVPRPDLALTYETADVCVDCHTTQNHRWAADTVARWRGGAGRADTHFVAALDAGRRGRVDAERALAALATDATQPGIARASALELLPPYYTGAALPALQSALTDPDPLVRLAAAQAAGALPPAMRPALLAARLTDPVRAVRLEAARGLIAVPPQALPADRQNLHKATAEFIAAEMASADRPESHLNLSVVYAQQGQLDAAQAELETALRLDPRFVPALINLADLYRVRNRDAQGERFLQQAIAAAPQAGEPLHALGLLRVRQGRMQEATELLGQAAQLLPDARYAYVYGVALQSTGHGEQAVAVLERAHTQHPTDRDILVALIDLQRQRGDLAAALQYADALVRLAPGDAGAAALREELRRGQPADQPDQKGQ
jgi:predicted CXXCH cytochrome family protein